MPLEHGGGARDRAASEVREQKEGWARDFHAGDRDSCTRNLQEQGLMAGMVGELRMGGGGSDMERGRRVGGG